MLVKSYCATLFPCMDSQDDDDCQPPAKLHIYIQWHEEQEHASELTESH